MERGEVLHPLAVHLVGYAYRDLLHTGEYIQLGQSDFGCALDHYAVAAGHHVEASHPAGAARSRAILASGLAKGVGLFAEELRLRWRGAGRLY